MIFGFKKKTAEVSEEVKVQSVPEELLEIDHELGLSYCMNMEDLYRDMLKEFCTQSAETLSRLNNYYQAKDWANYGIIAHGLKTNSRTIGANNFSAVSLQHEMAGKESNAEFIENEYTRFTNALKGLVDVIEKMLQ